MDMIITAKRIVPAIIYWLSFWKKKSDAIAMIDTQIITPLIYMIRISRLKL